MVSASNIPKYLYVSFSPNVLIIIIIIIIIIITIIVFSHQQSLMVFY